MPRFPVSRSGQSVSDKSEKGRKDKGQVVFQKRTSMVFKKLQVVRFYDEKASR